MRSGYMGCLAELRKAHADWELFKIVMTYHKLSGYIHLESSRDHRLQRLHPGVCVSHF